MKKLQNFFSALFLLVSASAKSPAQEYFITASPTNVVVGEKVRVAWTSPLLTFDVFNFVGWFTIEASDRDYIERRFTLFRFGDTDFEMNVAGKFNFRLFTGASIKVATSPPVRVSPLVADPFAIQNYPSHNRNIIAFGDSLVAGVGASPEDSLVAELARLITAPVQNGGVAGDTTERARTRLADAVLARDPQVVIVLLGGNDVLQGVSTAETVVNLRAIVRSIQESGAVVILVGIQGGAFTDRLADGFRTLAAETRAAYVPNVLRGIIGNPLLSSDAVHPNAAGYRIVAQRILPALEKLFLPKLELRLVAARPGAGIELHWHSLSNRVYRVFGSKTIVPAMWRELAFARSRGGDMKYLISPTASESFFRLREDAP